MITTTLLMLLISLMVAACGAPQAGTTTTAPAENGTAAAGGAAAASTGAPPADAGGKTTIRFTTWFGPGDIDAWKQVIKGFEAKNPNISVKFEPLERGKYWTKLQTQLASKTAPDVIGMSVGLVFDYAARDQLLPLDTFIKETNHDLSTIPAGLTAEGQWPSAAAKQYALPWRFAGGTLFINKTAFDEAGIPYPEKGWTIDDFMAAARKLTKGDRFGFLAPQAQLQASLMGSFGTAPVTPDRQHSNFNDPKMLEYKTWVRDLIWKEKVAPNPKDIDAKVDPFASGKVAMAFQGTWNFPVYRAIKDFEWDIAPTPTKDGKSKTYAGPDMISITKDSPNQAAAWKFVEYAVFSEEGQAILGTTGIPIRTADLKNEAKIAQIATQKPAHYKVFIDGAVNNATGYGFTPQFVELGRIENDLNFKLYTQPDVDIKAELAKFHQEFEKLLQSK
jgi:multiple sugar transport system substrate-binding protein